MIATRSTLNRPEPGCPLCFANGKLKVIAHYQPEENARTATAYLILAKDSPNGNDYLVIPANHACREDDLPDNFTAACKYLRWFIPWMKAASRSPESAEAAGHHDGINYGRAAGQTLLHVHK